MAVPKPGADPVRMTLALTLPRALPNPGAEPSRITPSFKLPRALSKSYCGAIPDYSRLVVCQPTLLPPHLLRMLHEELPRRLGTAPKANRLPDPSSPHWPCRVEAGGEEPFSFPTRKRAPKVVDKFRSFVVSLFRTLAALALRRPRTNTRTKSIPVVRLTTRSISSTFHAISLPRASACHRATRLGVAPSYVSKT